MLEYTAITLFHMERLIHKIRSWRTNRTLKHNSKARYCDKYLRKVMIGYDRYYLTKDDHELIKEAISETKGMKDHRSRFFELLCLHGMIIRNEEEATFREENLASCIYQLHDYHVIILLDAYIEMISKPRVKKLYRFHGSKNLFKNENRKYRERMRARSCPIQITV